MRKRMIVVGSTLGVIVAVFVLWLANSKVSVPGLIRLAFDEVCDVVGRKVGLRRRWFEVERDPLVVRRLAWPAASAYVADSDRRSYVSGFSDGFKTGLTSPTGMVTRGGDPKEIAVIAFNAGRAAALSGTAAAKNITLRDYGYEFVTVTGKVSLGFEQAHFVPLTGNEVWWIRLIPREQYSTLRMERSYGEWKKRDERPVIATVKGYLSPPRTVWGGYGHMGGYPREIVVTGIIEVHRAEPAAAR
jgi:hypothetical protein